MPSRAEKVGTVVLTALIVGGISIPAPAHAAPGSKITSVPDGGSRPQTTQVALIPSGTLAMPKGPNVDPLLSLGAQVDSAREESGLLSERINELQEVLDRAKLSQAWAEHGWKQADDRLKLAKESAAATAAAAYQNKDKIPVPLQNNGLLNDLLLLQPGAQPTGEGAAYELAKATAEEHSARVALDKANDDERLAAAEVASAIDLFTQRDNARIVLEQRLLKLKSEDALKKEREFAKLATNYDAGQSNAGLMAHPETRKAVLFALQQLGKPWRFAEEGPDFFDCSGLTQTSYRQAGVLLPRVAKDQYYAYRAKPVALSALLPGDLLFYARDPKDWKTIHHVMIYLGKENGVHKIVHSPRLGDVVKIANINLGAGNQVDFAVRIIDAVPVPQPPAPTPTPTPTPTVTPTPTPTVTPTTPAGNTGA